MRDNRMQFKTTPRRTTMDTVSTWMVGWKGAAWALLASLALFAGCDCDGDETGTPALDPSVMFVAPVDGAFLAGTDDQNSDKDGVQPAITVSVQNATSGSVTLSVFPDENASTPTDSITLDVSSAGELTTTDLTVAEGNNLLRAALLDTSGVELTKDEVRVSLRTGSAAMVAITAPADGATLTDSDDTSAQVIGFQTDVRVTLTDVPDSQTIALSVNGSEVATGSTAAISSSFTFQEVTLPEGAVNIEVSVSGPDLVETLSDQVTVTVTLEEPQCEIVSISPAPGGGACDFDASSTDAEPETVGYQSEFTITLENCDSAAVELLINGQATGAVMATDGTAVAVVTLNEGENRVQATAIEGNRSGMSDEFVYLVDTQEPTVGFTNLIDGQVLNFLDDRDSDLSNGLDIVVELATEGADGASPSVGLSIGDTDLTADPDGDGNVRFDDVVLDMQGEIDLTATAVDACGNETSTTITVNVSLLALALSIDAPETGALLGPMEDNDLMAEGLQTEFTVTADGFVEGTEVAINCRRAGSQAFFRRGVAMVGAENTFNIPVTLPEGDYTCRAEVEGPPQVFSTGIDVSVVLAVAGVDITFPDDGAVVRETSVDVTALVVNAPAAQATLTVGDTSVTAQAVAGGLSFADVPLDEGANTLTVTLDAFPTAIDTIDVILDTEAPTITFNSPSTDASTVTEADDVTGSLDDGIQIDVAVTVSDTNPGSEVCISTGLSQAQCAVVQDDGTATVPGVQLIPGAVTLTATAEDQAGNTATTTLDVTVDIDRPVVTVTSPLDGTAVTTTTLDVEVTVDSLDEDGELALYVNDEDTPVQTAQVTSPGGTNTFTNVQLSENEPNIIWATITDSTGVGASPRIVVTVDTTAPDVVFVSPTDGTVFSLASLDVDGTLGFQTNVSIEALDVADGQPSTLTVTCGDEAPEEYTSEIDNERAAFRRVTLTDQETCVLEASVVDRANNEGDSSITINVDRLAPTLEFVGLREGDVISINQDDDPNTDGLQLDIRVNVDGIEYGQEVCLVDDEARIDVCVDFVLAEQSVIFPNVTLPNGDFVLTVDAEDDAGNLGRSSVLIRADASPLSLTFVDPDDAVTLLNREDDRIPATPEFEAAVSIIGVSALGGSTAYLCSDTAPGDAPACQGPGFRRIAETTLTDGLANGFFDAVPLPEGESRLLAEAFFETDEQWVLSEEITVDVDTVPPTVESFDVVSDTNSDMFLGSPEDARPEVPGLFGQLSVDLDGVEEGRQVRFISTNSNNAGGLLGSAILDADGAASVTVRLDEGPHTVSVSATDIAGNALVSPEVMFTVDITAPQLTFANLFNGQELAIADDIDPNTDGLQLEVVASSNEVGRTVSLFQVVGELDAPDAMAPDDVLLGTSVVAADRLASFANTTLPNGNPTLALRVFDTAGNVATRTISVQVDVAAPTVTITAPADESTFTEEEEGFVLRPGFQVTVTVESDEIGGTVQLFNTTDGIEVGDPAVISASGTVSVPVTLVRGSSALEARVTDALGNVGRSPVVDVTVDIDGCGIVFRSPMTSPVLINEDNDGNPDNGVALDFEAVVDDLALCSGQQVDLVVNDAILATATVDGEGVVLFDGVSLPSPSTSTVFARIVSTEGDETTTVPYSVVVDVVDPTVSFVTPSSNPAELSVTDDLSALAGLQTDITLDVSDAVGGFVTVTSDVGGIIAQDRDVSADGQLTLSNLTFTEGVQRITATVRDRAGNTAETSIDFVVDVTPPSGIALDGEQTNRRRGTSSLSWVAPGDDGTQGGPVTRYELYYSDEMLTDGNLDEATLLATVEPTAAPASEETFELESLPWTPDSNSTSSTWFVAVVAVDDLGNMSPVGSNFTITQELLEARFTIASAPFNWGVRVIGLGDINNDGFPDAGITHPGSQRMWILYGADALELPTGETAALQEISIALPGGFTLSGLAASAVGDVNGDSISDFAVGGLLANGSAGGALIFFGVDGGQISGTPDVEITGVAGGSLGVDVGPAGNFSDAADEGIDDIVLGSTTAGGGAGAAFVVLGRETWPAAITMSSDDATNAGNNVIRLVGAANGDEFGYQVLGVPDVGTAGSDTADGFNELAVGSQLANGDRGRVSIFYGGPLANFAAAPVAGVDDVAIETFDPQGANFGGELAVGDVTGDGTPDLIVGAYGSDGVGIFAFDSGIATTVTEYWTRPGAGAFGESLALSDVDSDGDLDLLAGGISRDELAIFFNVSGSFEPNPMTLGNPADIALTETSDWGRYVDPIGDINNDGLEDFIVSRAGASQVVIFY